MPYLRNEDGWVQIALEPHTLQNKSNWAMRAIMLDIGQNANQLADENNYIDNDNIVFGGDKEQVNVTQGKAFWAYNPNPHSTLEYSVTTW